MEGKFTARVKKKDLQSYADLYLLNSKHIVPRRTLFSLLFLFNVEPFLLVLSEQCAIHTCLCTFLQQSPYSIEILINVLKRFKLFSIEFGY